MRGRTRRIDSFAWRIRKTAAHTAGDCSSSNERRDERHCARIQPQSQPHVQGRQQIEHTSRKPLQLRPGSLQLMQSPRRFELLLSSRGGSAGDQVVRAALHHLTCNLSLVECSEATVEANSRMLRLDQARKRTMSRVAPEMRTKSKLGVRHGSLAEIAEIAVSSYQAQPVEDSIPKLPLDASSKGSVMPILTVFDLQNSHLVFHDINVNPSLPLESLHRFILARLYNPITGFLQEYDRATATHRVSLSTGTTVVPRRSHLQPTTIIPDLVLGITIQYRHSLATSPDMSHTPSQLSVSSIHEVEVGFGQKLLHHQTADPEKAPPHDLLKWEYYEMGSKFLNVREVEIDFAKCVPVAGDMPLWIHMKSASQRPLPFNPINRAYAKSRHSYSKVTVSIRDLTIGQENQLAPFNTL
ncbi:uncharacterized protein BDR25DRAFT_356091 [Lindgomyces ingoldianus]|uniref:Uncharacterized protein n=1 Tax=Lindgomyces ingoldianus TaxID=673940 RepID=A0ACB6QS60_9PLEO|nr:uncharacterized protein BDR25DRAFT_356091 [Lindgomyces ingoldianus]KAF2469848.1 hypothetical protein BDR25DRAFT_356091 [Lindgomyces ingoldianus]